MSEGNMLFPSPPPVQPVLEVVNSPLCVDLTQSEGRVPRKKSGPLTADRTRSLCRLRISVGWHKTNGARIVGRIAVVASPLKLPSSTRRCNDYRGAKKTS
jgi:hypothetical protein